MKQPTNLPETPVSPHITLTPEQKEFLAPFGPGLCRMWPLVFDLQHKFLASISDFVGATRPASVAPYADQANGRELRSDEQPQAEPVATRSDP